MDQLPDIFAGRAENLLRSDHCGPVALLRARTAKFKPARSRIENLRIYDSHAGEKFALSGIFGAKADMKFLVWIFFYVRIAICVIVDGVAIARASHRGDGLGEELRRIDEGKILYVEESRRSENARHNPNASSRIKRLFAESNPAPIVITWRRGYRHRRDLARLASDLRTVYDPRRINAHVSGSRIVRKRRAYTHFGKNNPRTGKFVRNCMTDLRVFRIHEYLFATAETESKFSVLAGSVGLNRHRSAASELFCGNDVRALRLGGILCRLRAGGHDLSEILLAPIVPTGPLVTLLRIADLRAAVAIIVNIRVPLIRVTLPGSELILHLFRRLNKIGIAHCSRMNTRISQAPCCDLNLFR